MLLRTQYRLEGGLCPGNVGYVIVLIPQTASHKTSILATCHSFGSGEATQTLVCHCRGSCLSISIRFVGFPLSNSKKPILTRVRYNFLIRYFPLDDKKKDQNPAFSSKVAALSQAVTPMGQIQKHHQEKAVCLTGRSISSEPVELIVLPRTRNPPQIVPFLNICAN